MSHFFTRTCNRCQTSFEATPEHFPRDSSRPLGLAYECRTCQRTRKHGKDKRVDRWFTMTEDQRERAKKKHRRYWSSIEGRATSLVSSYKKIDARSGRKCDLTQHWVLENITCKPCTYCGVEGEPIGCDRIDNDLGHTMDNVVPACTECNLVRGNRFSPDEMKLIGAAIREVWRLRGRT